MRDLVKRTERFVRTCHAGQCRKGTAKAPYAIHLEEVASLVKWGGSEKVILTACLDDTFEDCPSTNLLRLRIY